MKKNTTNINFKTNSIQLGCGANEKWPAQDEQTIYSKLTISSKEESPQRKE